MVDQQLSRDSWLLAGQELLRKGGIGAVKLGALTAKLGRTTGSFYHHFEGMAQYLDALAHYYGVEQVEAALAEFAHLEPTKRIAQLIRRTHEAHMHPISLAMRDWASSSAAAAEAVRISDARLLEFIEQALLDLGFDRPDAQTRAFLLVAAGVARIETPWRPAHNIDRLVIDLFTSPTPTTDDSPTR